MDLRQLEALLAVAEEGSFTAAADRLHTVQSNVSGHVHQLESELVGPLANANDGRRCIYHHALILMMRNYGGMTWIWSWEVRRRS